jgi:hypothetical protein
MTTRKTRAVIASTAESAAAAEELLVRGNAVDAVVAGVFAACAMSPTVLLGPVQILAGGAGAGLFAVDGRVRQPGIGAPRPRGFMTEDSIPDAARVGMAWLPTALSVAVAALGSSTFNQVSAPGVALAKGTPRHKVLQHIVGRGGRALEEQPLSGELLVSAGRPSGGLLTEQDLASPHPEVVKASRTALSGSADAKQLITLPWSSLDETAQGAVEISRTRVVLAVDRNASFAIACWEEAIDGLWIDELGLRAPFLAVPVRRGQTRERPGDARPSAAPIALVGSDASIHTALATYGASDAFGVLGRAIAILTDEGRFAREGNAQLTALTHDGTSASVIRA